MTSFNTVTRNHQTRPKCFPQRICLVDKSDDSLSSLAKEIGLPVTESYSNNNQMEELISGTLYVVHDFENNPMVKLFKASSKMWIVGPTFLAELASDRKLELRKQPTYCTAMYGLCFHINCPGNRPLMARMVQLIKWMGGLFVSSPNIHVTHMISTSVRAKGYLYCWTFNVPIMTPEWVEYCWQQRTDVGFKAVLHTESYKLPGFADLYLCFVGFNSTTTTNMAQFTKENGGSVVLFHDPKCTHMVFSDDYIIDENNAPITKNIYLVTSDWFWSSVRTGDRMPETEYEKCILVSRLSESYIYMDVIEHGVEECDAGNDKGRSSRRFSILSPKSFLEDRTILEHKDIKKRYNFEELLLTEKNYIISLQSLINVKCAALNEDQSGGPILNKAEANSIFGNLEQIVQIHQQLAKVMEENLNEWDSDTKKSMRAIISAQYDMLKEYQIYARGVEDYQRAYDLCEKENCRFKKLIMSNKLSKEDLKHVFIRPIQRLCSIFLLLTELKKHSRENSSEKEIIKKAIDAIKGTLDTMNENKMKSDNMKELFDIFYAIENCPPDLITSHRQFIAKFSAQEITKIHDLCNSLGVTLVFFLFSDVLVVTKIRKSKSSKPYKHLVTISLCMIVKILHFDAKNESNVFGFITRDVTNDRKTTTCCFQYTEDGKLQLDEVLLLIAKQISLRSCSKTAEDYILNNIPPGRISVQPINACANNKGPSTPGIVEQVRRRLFGSPNPDYQQENKTFKRRSRSCSELDIWKENF